MNGRENELDRTLDGALEQIRRSELDPGQAREATERVWQRLQHQDGERHEIRSCADFQRLIGPYLRDELGPARALLVKDHLGECVPCRRVLNHERGTARRPARAAGTGGSSLGSRLGWRVAAAAVIFLAVVGFSFRTELLSFESGGFVRVESVEGELFRVTGQGTVPLTPGQTVELEAGEGIRTAKDSAALLRLPDGSQVEMRDRSELGVRKRNYLLPGRADDDLLDLERGSIIVEAADQGAGKLFVGTDECTVAVTGTVFAVNHGANGSRVSVIEGEVEVRQGAGDTRLEPGQQATTRDSLESIPIEDEIAWSRKREQYVALLREVRALGREMDRVLRPGLRYETDLLDLTPADTVVYVGMPNVSNGLAEAWGILRSRVAANPILAEWWQRQVDEGHTAQLDGIFERIRAYGDPLGGEILLTVPLSGEALQQPLFLARVSEPRRLFDLIEADLARLDSGGEAAAWLERIEGALPAAPATDRPDAMFFWVEDGLLAVSPSFQTLRVLDSIRKRQLRGLAGSTFHARLAERYAAGVEWLVGVDLETILHSGGVDPDLEALGFADVQHLVAERRSIDERNESRADLIFNQPRRRLAAWLAAPAPLGSLGYVSPDANFVVAFAMQDLGTLVDELCGLFGADDAGFRQGLAEFEQEHEIDVRRDIAAPLGGEFALALDGPVLPKPSWKLIVEVYDPAGLQRTIERLVQRANREFEAHGARGITLERGELAGRDTLRITSLDTGIEAHVVFDDGYAIVAPSRALLDRALQTRALGLDLLSSPGFRARLPHDRRVNFSGVLYHDLAPIVGPLSGALQAMAEAPGAEPWLLSALSEESAPGLVLIYGEPDRIRVVATSEGGLLSSGLSSLSGFGGFLAMQQSLVQAVTSDAGSGGDAPRP